MTTQLPFPALYADFTLEGTANPQYFLNGVISIDNFADWLTAISGTFSRSSTAYYTNSSGNLAQAASGVIRFDYDPISLLPRGLLLEGAETNSLLQSNTFSNASWTLAGTSITQNATGPDGVSNSAWTVVGNASNLARVQQTIALPSSFTTSIYAKAGTSGFLYIETFSAPGSTAGVSYFNLSTGAAGTQNQSILGTPTIISGTPNIRPYPNGWYRIELPWTGGVSNAGDILFIGICDADGSRNITNGNTGIFFGAQLENILFASSFIPTTSSPATRQADSLTAASINSWYNAPSGVLYVAGDTFADNTQNNNALAAINDGSSANKIEIRAQRKPGANGLAFIRSGNADSFVPLANDSGQSTYSQGVLSRAAISSSANNFIYDRDANPTVDSGSSGAMPVSPNQIVIGSNDGGGNLYGHVTQIGYWSQTFTVAQLQGLTSGNFVFIPSLLGPNVVTTLTNGVPAKAFTKKHYSDLINDIRYEGEIARYALEGLSEKDRADLEYESAESDFAELESALNRSVSVVNWGRMAEAKEKLEAARKKRDHQYYMEIVDKMWAEHNKKQKK